MFSVHCDRTRSGAGVGSARRRLLYGTLSIWFVQLAISRAFAVDPAQPNLARSVRDSRVDDGCVLARQRALCLHAASEFSVKSLDHVCRAQRLPLRFGEG